MVECIKWDLSISEECKDPLVTVEFEYEGDLVKVKVDNTPVNVKYISMKVKYND